MASTDAFRTAPSRPRTAAPASATPAPTGARRRVTNLDVLRALSALAVLGIHAYALGRGTIPIRAERWFQVPLLGLASGVWMFFVISGYVISRPFVDALLEARPLPALRGYAWRRILRIYPLYWVTLAVVIAIAGVDGLGPWLLLSHVALLNNLVPRQQESLFSVTWTLTIEVIFYAAIPLCAYAARAAGSRRLTAERLACWVIVSWLASIAFTVFAGLQGDGGIGLWLRGVFPGMWASFCPGILLAIGPHLRAPRARRWLLELPASPPALVLAAVLVALGVVLSTDAPLRFGISAYELLTDAARIPFALGYGIIAAAALRSPDWGRHARWALQLGLASYGIYLIHPVVGLVLTRAGLVPIARATVAAYVVNALVLTALTVPLALLSWRALERPALGLARRLGRSGASPTVPGVTGEGIREFWNERAREDALYFVDTRRRYGDRAAGDIGDAGAIVDLLLSQFGLEIWPGDRVLEIGCGVGRLTRQLAGRAREVIALDVSDEMLARARALAPDLANVRWRLGDGVSLTGVDDASIDAALSTVVFQHVPDPAITLGYVREVGRVLRPGGWAVLQVSNDPAVHRPRDTWRHRARAALGRGPRGQRHPAWLGSWVRIGDVRAAAAEAGMGLEGVVGEGTQYCQVLLRRPGPAAPRPGPR